MDGNDDILSRILAGETRAIARLMSRAEGRTGDVADIMADVHKNAGRAHVIGLTGVPGSGKSTLVHAMARRFRADGRTVGIVAVDPSSPYSGGAILGDRVRMSDLATDEGGGYSLPCDAGRIGWTGPSHHGYGRYSGCRRFRRGFD